MAATRIENVPGRSPVKRNAPSRPTPAPAMVTGDVLRRSDTEAPESGALEVSEIRPRSSNAGGGADGEACAPSAMGELSSNRTTAFRVRNITLPRPQLFHA